MLNNPFTRFAGRYVEAALGLFYPNVCQLCGLERATVKEGFVGSMCAERVKWTRPPFCSCCGLVVNGAVTDEFVCGECQENPPAFCRARTAVRADAFMLDVIHRYKYGHALYLEPFLAELLTRQAVPVIALEKWDFIVPVPLHSLKKREREFNQAERLARCLGRVTHIPVNTHFIRRVEPTRSQTTLTRAQRAENVRNAFAPCKRNGRGGLQGESILLFDDVMTTGATANACARALLEAGAGKVCVWALARGAGAQFAVY